MEREVLAMTFLALTPAIYVNAKQYNIAGDGSTDDTTNIQNLFNTVSSGTCIIFPASTYLVSASLLYPGNIRIIGAGDSDGGTVFKVKTGTALTTPVLCSADWYNNSSTCGNPVEISDIQINGNNAMSGTAAHGFVSMNFWSSFDRITIKNVAGDGFLFSAQSQNGTHISNTCVEAKISRIQVRTCGGDGVHIKDNGSGLNSCTDGFLRDCLITGTGARGINNEMSPGWIVEGNHVYGTVTDAISLSKCYATRNIGNYVDGFGSGSSSFIAGISMSCLDGRGSSCIGNHVGFDSGSTATGIYHGIRITGAGSSTTVCTVAHNTVAGGNQSGSLGYVLQTNSSQVGHPWTIYFHDNDSTGVATRLFQDSNVTGGDVKIIGHLGSEGAAVTAAAGANAGTSPPAPVLTNATDVAGQITFGTGTSPAAGAQAVITFNTAYTNAPKVTITPINSASAALNLYVTSTTTNFTVSCVNAPSASQANTTYGFNYHVLR